MHWVMVSGFPVMVTVRSVEFGSISEATWIEAPLSSRISLIFDPPLPMIEPHWVAGTISLNTSGGINPPQLPFWRSKYCNKELDLKNEWTLGTRARWINENALLELWRWSIETLCIWNLMCQWRLQFDPRKIHQIYEFSNQTVNESRRIIHRMRGEIEEDNEELPVLVTVVQVHLSYRLCFLLPEKSSRMSGNCKDRVLIERAYSQPTLPCIKTRTVRITSLSSFTGTLLPSRLFLFSRS